MPIAAAARPRSVRERSIEIDRGVGAIAERLVSGLPATAELAVIGEVEFAAIGVDEADVSFDDLRAVFAHGNRDVRHS